MQGAARLQNERAFHDRQARDRARDLANRSLAFSDDEYLGHETWIAPALARLGDVRGRRILDLGCGHGMAAVVLARRGADVIGLDLSIGYVREAQERARANGVSIRWLVADGERLPFADDAFDGIWGNAVLHHLDPLVASHELRRVLAPGGTAVICEPWGENPLLAWARRRLPYPRKSRTPDEAPLTWRGLGALRDCFPDLHCEGHQLLAMLGRVIGPRSWLTHWDTRLLRRLPILQCWCRYVVVTVHKTASTGKWQVAQLAG
jgi:SAM-dependent methyltransferase